MKNNSFAILNFPCCNWRRLSEEKLLCDFENEADLKLWAVSINDAPATGNAVDQLSRTARKALRFSGEYMIQSASAQRLVRIRFA